MKKKRLKIPYLLNKKAKFATNSADSSAIFIKNKCSNKDGQ